LGTSKSEKSLLENIPEDYEKGESCSGDDMSASLTEEENI
jgi:hypothetical protein